MTTIPFEAQMNDDGQRTCGAAALNMVYKSLGLDVRQSEVWSAISVPDTKGGRFAKTYKMVLDAGQRGFHAVAYKARDPIRSTRIILKSGSNVIMNHRLKEKSDLGHYTVALGVYGDLVRYHDPQYGRSQTRKVAALRALWQKEDSVEITGNTVIAIARNPVHQTCTACGMALLEETKCPSCGRTFGLQPVSALGCTNVKCDSRLWELVLCPYCDCVFSIQA